MIVFLRKHAKWLMVPLFSLIIFAFVFFMSVGPARNSGGRGSVDTNIISGKIYNEDVTPEKYTQAQHDVELYYLFNDGNWPKNLGVSQEAMQRQIYIRMMLSAKAKAVGIHINDAQVAAGAADRLRSPSLLRALQVRGDSVPYAGFVNQILEPANLTDADFENFVRDDLANEQLQLIYGLPGLLVTPMEATNEYVRQYQEMSSQIVFFSASNYLSQIRVTPGDVGMFYTNYMADYRLPDRRQVSYVAFSVSNYLQSAEQLLMKSNLDAQVDYNFKQMGVKGVPGAKTPEEAKAAIRKAFIHQRALYEAGQAANDFAQTVFNVTPASPQNLATVARQKGLSVQTTAPFSAEYGPDEFEAPAAFTRTAFVDLSSDSPISEPIPGPNAVYVVALDGVFPSEIPPLDQIRPHVTHDLQVREATIMAQRAGTNFVRTLTMEMASGRSFAAASIAAGAQPQILPPFSLSSQDMPELNDHATLGQVKQAAFTTPLGIASGFEPTEDGGFVLYVESKMPIDEAKMSADMPQFMVQFREQREMQAFNEWVQREGSSQLRTTPIFTSSGTLK